MRTTLAPARPMRVTDRIIQTDYMTVAVLLAPHTDEAIDVMKGVEGGITCVARA